ncbi:protein kinase [Streptomyces sp. NPDC018031]|uniref:serine/threonine-protein kinase n=1 Tax=Streptomyces sp. NPDC018031 TaxID=3365033 RepID=UPI0037A9492C
MAGVGVRPLGEDDPKRLGPYRLLWRLTTGGMGRIYLARSRADGPLVAVKTLLAEGVVSEPDRKRFAREVELARRVDSTCTARVLDADARARRPWMAIEYVAAPSLGDLVREAGPLPPAALPWVAAGAVQALLALHDKGVVHRDVKPQNILLPQTGPLLIDFGVSHAIDRTTTSLTLGTIDYTSPEQALGERSTAKSDVFSLGATLFQLAVGRAPYPETDDGPLQRLARVQNGRLDLAGLPPELDPLIRPCLAVEPDRRPAPADLLLLFLEAADRMAGRRPDGHRLPVRWTALIGAYEAHGRALSTDLGAAAAMADERTRPVPPPPPTLVDTRERAARREREQQALAAREQRERELRELADAARRARERAADEHRSGTPGSAGTGSRGQGPASGVLLLVLLVAALVVWRPWDADDGSKSPDGAAHGSSTSASPAGQDATPPATGPESGRLTGEAETDTPDPDGGSGDDASGGYDEPEPETSSPEPERDPTEEAFQAVSVGDCLPVFDTGRGGGSIDWSAAVPPKPVSCGGEWAGLVRVTGTTGSSCPGGTGQASWTYSSSVSGETTRLCLTRVYRKHYCMLGKQSGDRIAIGPMTAVDCRATQVPAAYNQIMHITGVYQAPPGAGAGNCVQGPNDRTRYWAWLVDDGGTLLCTTVFQGG